jgi:glycosyltransferase involved in cell wall biosynthesis
VILLIHDSFHYALVKLFERGFMKVGWYLNNKNIPNADLRKPELGNPGIGGSEFNAVTVPYYLNKKGVNNFQSVIYAHHIDLLPSQLDCCKITSCTNAIQVAAQDDCDFFVFRPSPVDIDEVSEIVDLLNLVSLRGIAWLHNDLPPEILNILSRKSSISRAVCVGREQLKRIRYHSIFRKSCYIFNGFDPIEYIPNTKKTKSGKNVVFLGAIIPAKSFHCLARIWPSILKEVPDAKLTVIGSGALYSDDVELGEWGVAEATYENEYIRPYLSNSVGEVDKSVWFAGKLGVEKIEILQNADVGVVNPLGTTETYCSCAVEFQAAGTPVVTGAYMALLDTVFHQKTGLLGKTDQDLVDNIVYLLKNQDVAEKFGENGIEFVGEKFSYEKICEQWFKLFEMSDGYVEKSKEFSFGEELNTAYRVLKDKLRPLIRKIIMAR